MSQVVLDISMSLDGFVTAPNDARGRGLGDGGEVLHYWVFGGPGTYDNVPDAEATGIDRLVLDEAMQGGAGVAGRRMYDVSGGWGGSAPGGVPCIVVTHRVDEQPDPASGFEFVDGVEAAIDRARQIAGDKRVYILGGASIAQQALQAGLVDELHIHVAPVILGAGRTRERSSTPTCTWCPGPPIRTASLGCLPCTTRRRHIASSSGYRRPTRDTPGTSECDGT
jgi:dihydrofolate reductase